MPNGITAPPKLHLFQSIKNRKANTLKSIRTVIKQELNQIRNKVSTSIYLQHGSTCLGLTGVLPNRLAAINAEKNNLSASFKTQILNAKILICSEDPLGLNTLA